MIGELRNAGRPAFAVVAVALAAVLFVALNILSQATFTARLDLTGDRRFTLGQGTRELLAGLDEPIELRLYYSRELGRAAPAYGDHARRVGELLDAYARASGGRIRVTRLDPLPFSLEEDQAVAEGLRGIPVDAAGTLAYFGVTGSNSTDDLDVLPLLAPERARFLEYDLTRMVYNLANPDKGVVGVLGDFPLGGSQADGFRPAAVMEAVSPFFETRRIAAPVDRLGDIDLLLLAQPGMLDERTLYAVDQYVMAGGPVLAFVDPFAEELARAPGAAGPAAQATAAVVAMAPLLEAWGVAVTDSTIVGSADGARRVTAVVDGRQVVTDYVPWFGVGRDDMDAQDPVTANLDSLQFRSAGAISAREDAQTTLLPLVSSGPRSALIALADIQYAPDPTRLLADFEPSGDRHVLAARITGDVASAFPDGAPAAVEDAAVRDAHRATAIRPLNAILVADADFLADTTWVTRQVLLGRSLTLPFAANGDFAVNALDNLRGGASLSRLRGRGVAARPLRVIDDMRRAAERQHRAAERDLQGRLDELTAEIRAIQQDDEEAGTLLRADQQLIDGAREKMLVLRTELRGVQHALRRDVSRLESRIRILNIWAVPALVALVALGLAFGRRRRTRRGIAAGAAGGRAA